MGYGIESVIVWRTTSPVLEFFTRSLRGGEKPSEALISEYEEDLQEIKWDKHKAISGTKFTPRGSASSLTLIFIIL
jgi:hypothetical protein